MTCQPGCICSCGQQGCGCHQGPWPPKNVPAPEMTLHAQATTSGDAGHNA